jgi:hypothetical protein
MSPVALRSRYGALPAMTNSSCTDLCAPNFFCASGSSSPTPAAGALVFPLVLV